MTNRYNRHIILSEIGQEGQDKISNAKVLVIGAGGLGCPVLQYLTAAGVGTIGVIDFDVVEISNLQRQVLFGKSSLGKNKAIEAKERLENLNDDITIIAYPEALTHQNALVLFRAYDIIVDGSDNFETRYLVNDACVITKKPLVFGAIYKFEGQVAVFNYNNGPSYRCLFPNKPQKEAVPNCYEVGVLGVLPGIIGSLQANEALKIILGIGDILSGKVLYFNALCNQTSTIKLKRNEAVIQSVLNKQDDFKKSWMINCCSNELKLQSISISDLKINEHIQFIDVREIDEQPKIESCNVVQMPLSDLSNNLNFIPIDKKNIVFCQSGIRSKKAVKILNHSGFNNCFSLIEGARELKMHLEKNYKTIYNER